MSRTAPTGSRRAVFAVRAMSSVVMIALVCAGVASPPPIFVLIATAFVLVGLWEFFGLASQKGVQVFRWVVLGIGGAMPWVTWQAATAPLGSWAQEGVSLWLVAGIITLCVAQMMRRESQQALTTVAITVFGILYIGWLFSFLVHLKLLPAGTWLVGFVLLVTKLGDMGSYAVGVSIGRTPLLPRISPKKTVEGLAGGLATGLLVAWLCRGWLPIPSWQHALAIGLLLSAGTHVGDMIESLFKRDGAVKDSGRVLPGLGGFLDVIDSLLVTIPLFYLYVRMVWY